MKHNGLQQRIPKAHFPQPKNIITKNAGKTVDFFVQNTIDVCHTFVGQAQSVTVMLS